MSCASCGAAVQWAVTPRGRRMPIEPRKGGNVAIENREGVLHASFVADGSGTHVSHFATCPQAAHWRRS
jgi:hypothetical protein